MSEMHKPLQLFLKIFSNSMHMQVVIMGLVSATLWLRTQLHPHYLGDATRYAHLGPDRCSD